jgi:hypothetical protein
LIEQTKIREQDLLRCATAALQEVKGHGFLSRIKIVEDYAARVARLAKIRINVHVDSRAEPTIDYVIESVLGSARTFSDKTHTP